MLCVIAWSTTVLSGLRGVFLRSIRFSSVRFCSSRFCSDRFSSVRFCSSCFSGISLSALSVFLVTLLQSSEELSLVGGKSRVGGYRQDRRRGGRGDGAGGGGNEAAGFLLLLLRRRGYCGGARGSGDANAPQQATYRSDTGEQPSRNHGVKPAGNCEEERALPGGDEEVHD